jgi:hypothetical protein
VTTVPLDPVEGWLALAQKNIERVPQILVLDSLLRRVPPTIPLPLRHPLCSSFDDVLAVGVEVDIARLGDGFYCFDCSRQLSALVGLPLVC